MSNKFKKLLCALLSAAMLFSSMSLAGFAAEDEAAAAEVTGADRDDLAGDDEDYSAVLATDAPVATEAPASYDYDNDAYYQKALALCRALGIITGYEDGSIKPESVVTRAEMATIVLRALNAPTSGSYKSGLFSDVTADYWAAGTIQNAYDQQIINGMGDGTFQPDGDVTAAQVQKMLVCAANFGTEAEYNGGWPGGYTKVADTKMKLNTGVSVADMNAGAERGNVIKMVYNALLSIFNETTGTDGVSIVYEAKNTWAKVNFNVYEERGVLMATSNASISSALSPRAGQAYIDSELFETELTGIDSLVGSRVTYYYKDVDGDVKQLLALVEDKTGTTVDLAIDDIKEFKGFTTNNPSITMQNPTKTYSLTNPVIMYNGAEISAAKFDSADASRKNGKSYDEFLKPTVGTLKLVDNDGDGKYDVVYIEDWQTMKVVSATSTKVTATTGYDSNGSSINISIDVDTSSNTDKKVTVMKGDTEVRARNLSLDDVISVKRSIDDMTIEIIMSGESITGTIRSTTTNKNGETVAVINGSEYVVAATALPDVAPGKEGIFYLDAFERIGFIDSANQGGLASDERYGWVMNAYSDEGGSDQIVQLYTSDGKAEVYTLADNVNFWGKDDTDKRVIKGDAVIAALSKTSGGVTTLDSSKFLTSSNGTSIRLVKYKLNSNNQINSLYCAVDKSASVNTDEALIVDKTESYNYTCRGSVISTGYTLAEDMILIQVPMSENDMKGADNYTFTTTAPSAFLNSSKAVTRHAVFGQFKDTTVPQLVIEYLETSSSAAPSASYYDNANEDGHQLFVVDSVGVAQDNDANTVYTLRSFGGDIITTRVNSALYDLGGYVDSMFYGYNGNDLKARHVWDAISNKDSIANYINRGDVLMIQENGLYLMRVVNIKELIEFAKYGDTYLSDKLGSQSSTVQLIGGAVASNTRELFAVGNILASSAGANSSVQVGKADLDSSLSSASTSATISVSSSALFTLIVIDENGNISYEENGTNTAELKAYEWGDEGTIGTGDLAYIYEAPKGRSNAGVIFRFND